MKYLVLVLLFLVGCQEKSDMEKYKICAVRGHVTGENFIGDAGYVQKDEIIDSADYSIRVKQEGGVYAYKCERCGYICKTYPPSDTTVLWDKRPKRGYYWDADTITALDDGYIRFYLKASCDTAPAVWVSD